MKRCERCKGGLLPSRLLLKKTTVFSIPPDWLIIPHCGHCGTALSKTSKKKIDLLMVEAVVFKDQQNH